MNVLSLFDTHNSIDEGFALAGYDVITSVDNNTIDGVIGSSNTIKTTIKKIQPIFFLGVSNKNKCLDIDDYVIYKFITLADEYNCSRDIFWFIGIMSNDGNVCIDFPIPSTDNNNDINPDTELSLAVAVAITEAVDRTIVMNDYNKFYNFAEFNDSLWATYHNMIYIPQILKNIRKNTTNFK